MFKLYPWNVLLWACGPTFVARKFASQEVNEKVNQMWRVHQNRLQQGLGKTYGNLAAQNKNTGKHVQFNNTVPMSVNYLLTGELDHQYIDQPLARMHQSVQNYPHQHSDWDDVPLYEVDTYERLKPFIPKKENVVGTTTVIPMDDNDEVLHFYDIQGESLYTNPVDPNFIHVDHGLEEDHVWAFRHTLYNQHVVVNQFRQDVNLAQLNSNVPFWTPKLGTPAFYTPEKYQKMLKQWNWRLGLELIKGKHYLVRAPNNKAVKASQKAEIQNYLAWVREQQEMDYLKDVYTTDNKVKTPKYNVNNEKELDAFIRYQQDLEAYNADVEQKAQPAKKLGKYRKGSLAQRIFEPLIDAERDENGTLVVNVDACEIRNVDEESLRKAYENARDKNSLAHDGEDDEEYRLQLMRDLQADSVSLEAWNQILGDELGVFKHDEAYDYATDLRRNFDASLAESKQQKIFKTIPDHVFWDIKKPLKRHLDRVVKTNDINPTREHYARDFFDLRANEEWKRNRENKRDLNQSISMFRQY